MNVWTTGAAYESQVGDAKALPVADDTFDLVVSGLVLNFVQEPARMVAEMVRADEAVRFPGCAPAPLDAPFTAMSGPVRPPR